MRVAVPIFGSRVAPTFQHCDRIFLGRVVAGGETIAIDTLQTERLTEDERIELLDDHRVAVLICGGIGRELVEELKGRGVQVINNVAGETEDVLACMSHGDLRAGYGISYRSVAAEALPNPDETTGESSAFDCIACADKVCLRGMRCSFIAGASAPEGGGAGLYRTVEAALDIASEPERILCRVAELVYFCLEMKYKHVGLAFCTDLFGEAETVVHLLRRFVRVTPICCKVGAGMDGAKTTGNGTSEPNCSPVEMARLLNEAKTEMNVAVGLCMGSDVVFSESSLAPVTTLFVKDRLLANNPVAAVHSRYVLDHILKDT